MAAGGVCWALRCRAAVIRLVRDMQETFCDHAWQRTEALRRAIHELPFNRELAAGTLPRAAFQHYIIQDALYLGAYARALAAAAVKATDTSAQEFFAEPSKTALVVERALHATYLGQFGIDLAEADAAEPSPTCLGYTSFLIATAQTGSYAELVAAILPCFWIYWDVGTAVAARSAPGNFYQPWIDTYSDPAFGAAVEQAKVLVDTAAREVSRSQLESMHRGFRRSTQFEWMFWDAAYRLEGWPV